MSSAPAPSNSFCPFLEKHYDNFFYNEANDWEKKAIELNSEKKYLQSWGLSTAARLPHVASAVVDAVVAPFALIGALFGTIPALFTWGKETAMLSFSSKKLVEKINHFFISLLGAAISPWAAYHVRDTNVLLGFLGVLGVAADSMSRRTVFAINLN